jgi:ATP-dependent helicase/nuclease subunit A
VLKSPIFGLDEQALFELAHDRKGSLIVALRMKQPEIAKQFDVLAELARESSPFSFYAELLGAQGGRKKFLSRLGLEANDALDEFLNLALEYERRETPSLQGFAAWLRTASAEVKRDMELARDEVRVMTVHGAKGLEAPIVVLADTTTEPAGPVQYQPRLLSVPRQDAPPGALPLSVWVPTKKEDTAATAAARATTAAEAENEYRRLLYVAMTRAADRLIVCGSVGERRAPGGCWYELIEQGLAASERLVEEPADFGEGTVLRFRKGPPDAVTAQAKESGATQLAFEMPPSWLTANVAPDPARAEPIRPSGFVDDPPLAEPYRAGQARQRALARGKMVHRLLQSLPEVPLERRTEMTRRFIARQKSGFSEAEQSEIAAQVLGLLTNSRFAELFAPGSRAEVPIVGRVNGRTVNGVVDRLVVMPDAVLIADYKTNRPAPAKLAEIADRYKGYVRQLALYRAVLERLYPGRNIRAALVWTDTPSLMEIPTENLHAALKDLTSP